ncbi:MAG: NUDIX hydrolase, partial [Thermogutta sp.]
MGSFHGEVVFQSRKFQVVRKEVAGSLEPVRYVVHHPGAVAILPVLDDGRLVLIRNYRAALDTKLLEIPAGTCEPGESAEAAAVRELEEETGYQAHVWQRLCQFYTSPG